VLKFSCLLVDKFLKLALTSAFFLTFFLLLPSFVKAETSILINSCPSQVNKLGEFEISFTVQLETQTEYYYKGRVGQGSTLNKAETYNGEWLGDSDSWSKFPILKTNDTGSFSGNAKLRIKDSALEGENKLILRVRKIGTDNNLDSSEKDLIVNLAVEIISPSPSILSPQPSVSTNATYKINDVKDENGNVLTSVKIYVDGVYAHHYAPETLTFCDNCEDGGFGQHTIRLEKAGYQDWSDTKDLYSGNSYEISSQMTAMQDSLSSSVSTTKLTSPSPTLKPSSKASQIGSQTRAQTFFNSTASAIASSSGQVLAGELSASPQASTDSPKILIPLAISGVGLLLAGFAFGPTLVRKISQK